MAKNLQDVLFEGFVYETNSFTTFYYIQAYKGFFLFKMGISKLGAVILPNEDNRLNVIVATEKEYKAFMKELQTVTELNCAYGHDEFYHWFYRFKHENEKEIATPLVKGTINIVNIFESYFENKAEALLHANMKSIVGTFTLDNQKKYIVHDVQYLWTPKNLMSKKPLKHDEEILMLLKKHFYGYENSKHTAVREKYDLMMEYPDLTRELLYVLENERYPEEMIVVDGWVAKDLIECADCDVAEAYFHLMNLRKNPEQENECLYELLKMSYSGLYEKTELKKELQMLKELTEKKDKQSKGKDLEQERISLDNGIPLRGDRIDIGPRPSIAQWLELTNAKSQPQLAPSISKEKYKEFLGKYTIPMIQDEIKKYIIGQDDLVEHVSTYIYYHALRQIRPTLYPRPFLITGPSGSGKTEAFRVVKNVFKDYFNVEIVDGTTITQEGWKGVRKLSVLLGSLSNGYILVIDEFDKLAKPAYDSGNNNVSEHIQAEFLKLLEGEYYTKDLQTDTSRRTRKEVAIDYDTRSLGIVLVGAFEAIRSKKENPPARIGFVSSKEEPAHEKELTVERDRTHSRRVKATKTVDEKASKAPVSAEKNKAIEITDEDLIAYGVITELVGRISDKCTTNKLTVEQYIQIVKNENSKVSQLMKELEQLGVETDELLDDDLISTLVEKSQTNLLGVRWVSSQIENLLLKQLCEVDIREQFASYPEDSDPEDEESEHTFF